MVERRGWRTATSRVARSYFRKLKGSRVLVEVRRQVAAACLLILYHIRSRGCILDSKSE